MSDESLHSDDETYPASDNRKRLRDQDSDGTMVPARRQRKIMSTIAAVVKPTDKDQNDSNSEGRWNDQSSKPHPQKAYLKPDTVKRNRRMFGALMGHLDRASTSLKKDASLIEKQGLQRKLVTEKNMIESKRVSEFQRKVSLEEKEKVFSEQFMSSL